MHNNNGIDMEGNWFAKDSSSHVDINHKNNIKKFEKESIKMTKKATKMIKTIASVIMAMALLFTMAAPVAFAARPTGNDYGSANNPLQAAITKKLVLSKDTIIPSEQTFNFSIVKKSWNGSTSGTQYTNMPLLGNGGAASVVINSSKTKITDSYNITIINESSDLINNKTWPDIGEYRYIVTEIPHIPYTAGTLYNEKYIFSKAVYELVVYVLADTDGSFYVSAVTSEIITGDDGEAATGKGDPTPHGKGDKTGEYDFSDLAFTNKYIKTNGGGFTPTESVLSISKKVDGYGSTTQPFNFNISVNTPHFTVEPGTKYIAYIIDSQGNVVKSNTTNPFVNTTTGAIEFTPGTFKWDEKTNDYILTPGTALDVKLTHGQRLSFINLPVGAEYYVKESATPEYTPSCIVTEIGVVGYNSGENTELVIPKKVIQESTVGSDSLKNSADFTNKYKDVSNMGVIVDNLPYITMIAMVLIALAAYVAFKSYKGAKNNIN